MSFRHALIAISVLLSAGALPQAAQASGDVYDVEVVVFKHARGEYFDSERWPSEPGFPSLESAIDFSDSSDDAVDIPRGYTQGSHVANQLSGIVDTLEQSSRYGVLSYQRWRQPGVSLEETHPIRIATAESFPPSTAESLPQFFATEGEIEEAQQALRVLDGTITIERSRFLHIHADLSYRAPVETYSIQSTGAQGEVNGSEKKQRLLQNPTENSYIQSFRLQQQRKTRSEEIQFLDHPLFGVIVLITPVEGG